MGAYVVKRLLEMIPVVILVTILVFLMLQLTGDPVRAIIGVGESLDEEQIELLRHELGLDRPLHVQYVTWLASVCRGDFGRSNHSRRLVTDELKVRLPVTLQLGLVAWLFSNVIAIPAGIISAVRYRSALDIGTTALATGGVAVPGFWLGIMLILLFGVKLGWLPTHGFVNFFDNPLESLKHLALPAFAMGLAGAALNMRQTRSAMLEVLAQDYIRTARAKGLRERSVIWVHALKNALLPVVTLMGLQIGRLFGGAVVIETLFAIPGMGRLLVNAVFLQDFPVVQACVLIIALAVLFANLATDLIYAQLDPRIRYA